MEDLQSWRTINSLDFTSRVKRVITTTDCESKHGLEVTLEELDNVLDQIAAASRFSSISLREKIKNGLLICIDNTLLRIF